MTWARAVATIAKTAPRTIARCRAGLKKIWCFMVNRLSHRILPSIEQLAQHAADLLEHPAGRPRIFTGGLEDLFLRKARLYVTGPGSCRPPAGLRGTGPPRGIRALGFGVRFGCR